MELLIAMVCWFGMFTGSMTVDQSVAMQNLYNDTSTCYVFEDGSGSCNGFDFPAYDDYVTPMHYSR